MDSGFPVYDQMNEGIQIIDPEFRYVYVNAAVAAQGRSSREALLGRTMMACYPGIEHTAVFQQIQACMTHRVPHQMVNEFVFPDGSLGYFQLRIQPVSQGVLILSFEITEQRRAEIGLIELKAMLEAKVEQRTAQLRVKNEELEQIAYIASHDLQEPLHTLSSHVQVLMEDCYDQLSEEARTSLDFIAGASERMRQLVRALLDYARLERVEQASSTDVHALVEEVLEDLSTIIQRQQAIVDLSPLPTLMICRSHFRQLFQNLITNAIKFQRPGVAPHIHIDARETETGWLFRVSDNGIGFDMRHRERIFVIFQRLHSHSRYEGTGIGLAHCKKIVALHGGEIWAESEPNVGSTFFFTIPRTGSGEVDS